MEADAGSSAAVISRLDYQRQSKEVTLQKATVL